MKKALTTALTTRFTAVNGAGAHNSFYTAVAGKMFDGEAPPGTVDPYAIYQVISYTDISTFAEETYDVLVQFSIFSSTGDDSTQIKDIETALNAAGLFRNQSFTFTGGTVLSMVFLQSDGPRKVIEESDEGENSYWQTDCDYQITIEKE